MLSCISLGMANTRSELQAVAGKTLMAVQKERLQVDIKKLTDKAITDLFKLGALLDASDTEDDSIQNVTLDLNVTVCNERGLAVRFVVTFVIFSVLILHKTLLNGWGKRKKLQLQIPQNWL